MKLGDLLKGVVGKNKYDREAYEEDSPELSLMQGYDSAIDKISDLSVCIDEEKVRTFLRGHKLFTKDGYFKWIHSTSFRDALAKAISQSNIITLKRGE